MGITVADGSRHGPDIDAGKPLDRSLGGAVVAVVGFGKTPVGTMEIPMVELAYSPPPCPALQAILALDEDTLNTYEEAEGGRRLEAAARRRAEARVAELEARLRERDGP